MKAAILTTVQYLKNLFAAIWGQKPAPSEWNKVLIGKFMKKGSIVIPDNYRGIILIHYHYVSVPDKIFYTIIFKEFKMVQRTSCVKCKRERQNYK